MFVNCKVCYDMVHCCLLAAKGLTGRETGVC